MTDERPAVDTRMAAMTIQYASGPHPAATGGLGAPTGETAIGDEVLVRQLRAGDNAAGDALVRRYCTGLLRYLRRLMGSDQLAEEMHQQTWVSVLENLDRFDPRAIGGGFKAWLFRIATNKANDHWRRNGRERSVQEGLKLVADDDLPAPGQRMDATEQQIKVRQAIEALPVAQKQVLMLRYYSGLKFVEIAELLGCPLNTALGRAHKAMIRLRELMEPEPEQEQRNPEP